jgi:hypothetical protein
LLILPALYAMFPGMTLVRIVAIVLLVAVLPPAPYPQTRSTGAARIEIHAAQIPAFDSNETSRGRFGSLDFRGGLVLTSSYRFFGGFSALRIRNDGSRFLALSDRAFWLSGRIFYENGRLAGMTDAFMAPVLDSRGIPSSWDTESLAESGDISYVGIEGLNQIMRFDYGKSGFLSRGRPIAIPPGIKDLPDNEGLEALEFVPKGFPIAGTLIAISERGLDEAGNIKGFLIEGPYPGSFSVKRSYDYDISDAALLPNGDLLLLERKYSFLSGVHMRIRRVALGALKPGALVDGPVLIEADMRCQIDDMEALSVFRNPSGEIILTLLSDDNFSPLQRTLLLQFRLP